MVEKRIITKDHKVRRGGSQSNTKKYFNEKGSIINLKNIKIELQHFQGCPNSPILIERVKEAIRGFANIEYNEVIVDSNEKAEEVKFRGSPTLLINGEDFENQPEPDYSALACRYYRNGLPTSEKIKERIIKLF